METQFKKGFALIIGVGNDLKGTVTDANAIAKILKDENKAAYPEDNVILLTEKEATHDGILKALDDLKAKVEGSRHGKNATVFIYYSGHGVKIKEDGKDNYYFIPNDYIFEDEKPLVAGTAFMEKVAAIPSRRSMILIDSCYAGGFKTKKVISPRKIEYTDGNIARDLAKGEGLVMIASATDNQTSIADNADGLSLFTEALIEALEGKGTEDESIYVSALDIARYLEKEVPAKAKASNHKQTPVINIQDYEGFDVCKHQIETVPAIPKIFTIYDQRDHEYHEALQRVLQNYVNFGIIESWSPDDIIPGDSISASLDKNLKESQIVIPLISINYYNNQTSKSLQQKAIDLGKDIIPIIVNHCPWEFDPAIKDRANEPKKDGEIVPVADWKDVDQAFYSVVNKIIKKAKEK